MTSKKENPDAMGWNVNVRLTEQHKNRLTEIAEQENTNVSALIRSVIACIVDERLTVSPEKINELLTVSSQLRRIGVNLNQLVHAYNAGMLTQPVNANQALSKIRELTESTLNIIMDITDENSKHNARTKKKVLSMLENRQT